MLSAISWGTVPGILGENQFLNYNHYFRMGVLKIRKAQRSTSMFGEPVVLMLMSLLGLALFVILLLVLDRAGS